MGGNQEAGGRRASEATPELQGGMAAPIRVPALSQVGELWDDAAGPAEPNYRSRTKLAMSQAVGGGGPLPPAHTPRRSDRSTCPLSCTNAQSGGQARFPRYPQPTLPRHRTCDGVQGCDDEHEDGGEVEVPAQADVHKESPCIQVNLGGERSPAEAPVPQDQSMSEPPTPPLTEWMKTGRPPPHTPTRDWMRVGGRPGYG